MLALLLFVLNCGVIHFPETTSRHGICLVRADDEGEEGGTTEEYETDEEVEEGETTEEYEADLEEGENVAIIDAMTGESVIPQDDEVFYQVSYQASMLQNSGQHDRSMEERDPNLRLMTYDVGDGEQTTYVYVEPTIEEMYRLTPQDKGQRIQRVTPQFNGFAGKFINMSNKKCTLYWYVHGLEYLVSGLKKDIYFVATLLFNGNPTSSF